MPPRQREEVLNTVLATAIVARGLHASPETIQRRGRQRPDVLISFRGLRCAIEGKTADVSQAKLIVQHDAMSRIDSGLTQLAIAVVYGVGLRQTPFNHLASAMQNASYEFCICTEVGPGDWQSGSIDSILDSLRRAHDFLSTDDAVKRAADQLSLGLEELASVLMENHVVCDRLIEVLGIGSPEQDNESSD